MPIIVSVRIKAFTSNNTRVRVSGHGANSNSSTGGEDGAVVVDLVNFQKFEMDTDSWFATFGSGTLLGDLTDRLYANGNRVIAHGTCPQVCETLHGFHYSSSDQLR